MYADNWRPELHCWTLLEAAMLPATIISNMTGIRCEALKVSLRDDDGSEGVLKATCWMSRRSIWL